MQGEVIQKPAVKVPGGGGAVWFTRTGWNEPEPPYLQGQYRGNSMANKAD